MENSLWAEIVSRKDVFLARSCAKQFTGFANDQLARMTGKKGQRPEIESKYGYDVKAAMHTLRLLYECKELVTEARITMPRPERDLLIRVRTGKYSMDGVVAMARQQFAECEDAAKASYLPEKVDRAAVSKLLAESYRAAWNVND